MSIIIVDDQRANVFVIEKILQQAGYRDTVKLSSAQELFHYLHLQASTSELSSIELILLDVMMPDIDGITACRTLQESEIYKNIPIIFITALEDVQKMAQALDAGGVDYLTKPIDKMELLARIRVALRLKSELDWHAHQEKQLRNELELATVVQRNVLSAPLQEQNITIRASYIPSSHLAGDMYYWQKIDEHRYGIILFDVMGHGVSASLVCMFMSSVLRETIRTKVDPELVITDLNRYIHMLHTEKDDISYYLTAIYLVLDTHAKTVEYVNAGHPAGYMCRDRKSVVPLDTGCCALGFLPDILIQKTVLSFETEVQIMLVTDGVIEALDPLEQEAEKILQGHCKPKWNDLDSELKSILSEEQKQEQTDDMCMVMIQAQTT
ncbi:response regulator [Bacillus thuringiensis]|uniref:PP2C family protein-serine/threonine phosphatase n=1 Tax=Bacillus thuringiensis TaxID=1428 RepID=UPI000BF3442E|nr:fused response regulator/phosphatase [Bacillus thuringiensis]PEZ36428.1 response regulator [Bacillus thuringiensis]PGY49216.1 response regulator [Bacillus thuringiensis]